MSKPLTMPCGKYKGRSIYDLPSSYLKWVAENWQEKTPIDKKICKEADKEYRQREKYNTHHFYEE